jgi:hypothetical protein
VPLLILMLRALSETRAFKLHERMGGGALSSCENRVYIRGQKHDHFKMAPVIELDPIYDENCAL